MDDDDDKLALNAYVLKFVARDTNPKAHCLTSSWAPFGTLVTGLSMESQWYI